MAPGLPSHYICCYQKNILNENYILYLNPDIPCTTLSMYRKMKISKYIDIIINMLIKYTSMPFFCLGKHDIDKAL